ncbi:MAG: serine/threonine protein kinase [Gemmataceae bacterium]
MASTDKSKVGHKLVQMGLVTASQVQECLQALGGVTPDYELLLRELERRGYLTPLQSDKLRKGETTGFFLGGYRLLYKIASGTFGRVYRGDDPVSGRVVAIKVLRRRWMEDPTTIELFEREGRVGMSLRHPNIVEILQVGRDSATGQYYIVMEFVEGGNLRDVLAIRRRFAAAEALKLAGDMAQALTYAWSRGVAHRDLKLTNVLLSTQGVAKLVDFGLARLYSAMQSGLADDIQVQRTVDYAGLERLTGVPAGDIRSDIYFLGCILYEMLSGRPPLEPTRDRHARMHRRRFENVPPLRPEDIEGPADTVLPLVETMMALDPRRRFQTPAQCLDAIRRALAALNGRSEGQTTAPVHSLFVVERDPRLQETLRERLRRLGYRVFVAADPRLAVSRFQQQPFAGLVVDVGTTAEEGLEALHTVLERAHKQGLRCPSVVLLGEDQAAWQERIRNGPMVAVLVRPLRVSQVIETLQRLLQASQTANR